MNEGEVRREEVGEGERAVEKAQRVTEGEVADGMN